MRTLLILIFLIAIGYFGISYQRDNNSNKAYTSGITSYEQGDHDQAITYLTKAIDVKPYALPPYIARARVYITKHQYLKASADLQTVLQLDNNHEQAHHLLTRVFMQQQKLPEAYISAQKIIQLNPQNIDAAILLVEVLIEMKQIDLASEYLVKIILQEPNNIESKLLYSKVLSIQGYKSAALDQLEDILATSPNNYDIKQQLGLAYFEMGNINLALPHLQMVAEQDQDVEDKVYEYLVEIHKTNNNIPAALDIYRKLIIKSPSSHPNAYQYIGNFHYENQNWSEAQLAYLQLIAIKPNAQEAKFKLGEIALHRENYKEALQWFNQAFENPQMTHEQAYKVANIYLDSNQLTSSLKWVNKAISQEKLVTYAHLKGLLLVKTGNRQAALSFLLTELGKPNFQQNLWQGYAALNAALLSLAQPIKATELLQMAVNHLPQHSIEFNQAYNYLALLHLQNNQLAFAQDALNHINLPNNRLTLTTKLLLAIQRNQHQTAISIWEDFQANGVNLTSKHKFAIDDLEEKFYRDVKQFSIQKMGNELPVIIADLYLKTALNAIASHDYVQAEIVLLKATEITPANAELYFQLGNIRTEQQQFSQAAADFNTAKSLNYNACSIAYGLGRAYVALEQYTTAKQHMRPCKFLDNLPAMKLKASNLLNLKEVRSARALYKNIIDLDQQVENVSIFIQYAELLYRIDKAQHYDEIMTVLDKVLAKDVKQEAAYMLKGELLHDGHYYSQAILNYRRAIELGADIIPNLITISEIQQAMFDEPGQMHTLSAIIDRQPHHLQALEKRAILLIKQAKYELAINDLSKLIVEYGFRKQWLEKRAESYETTQNYLSAIDDYSILINLEQTNFTYRFKRSELFYKEQNFTSALTDTNKLLATEPENVPALLLRGNIHQSMKSYLLSIPDFLHANQQQPLTPEHLHTLADVYYQTGQLSKSTGVLEKLLNQTANDQTILIKLATIMMDLGRYSEVTDILQRIDDTHSNAKVIRLQGIVAERRAIYPLAIEYYNRYLSIIPEDKNIRLKLAHLFFLIGQLDKSIDTLDHILILDRNNAEALVLRARIYKDQDYFTEAIIDATETLKSDNNNALAYEIRGISYFSNQQFELALADLERATQLNPNNVKLHENLSELYIFLKRTKSAIRQLTRAIKLSSNPSKLHLERGRIYQISEQYAKALKDYEKARTLAPENPSTWFKIAAIHILRRNYNQAIDAYSAALELTNNKGEIYYYIAMVHLYKKEFAKAQRVFEQAIDENFDLVQRFKSLYSTVASFEIESDNSLPPNIIWLLERGVKVESTSGQWYN